METRFLQEFQLTGQSIEQRFASGKELRKKIPRYKQGYFQPSINRIDPLSILEEQGKTRLPDLVPIRYARMLTSPFGFLRGGAKIMAADLAATKIQPVYMCRPVATCTLQILVCSLPLNVILFSALMTLMKRCKVPGNGI
jgi:hypothetical protein